MGFGIVNILFAGLGIVTSSLIIIILIDFIKNEYKLKQYGLKFWKSSIDVTVSLFAFIIYAIFSILSTTNIIYCIISELNNSFNNKWCISSVTEMIIFTFGKLFFYYFFLIRLYQIFKNSSLTVSIILLKTIAIVITINMLLNGMYVLIVFSFIFGIFDYYLYPFLNI